MQLSAHGLVKSLMPPRVAVNMLKITNALTALYALVFEYTYLFYFVFLYSNAYNVSKIPIEAN